MFFSKNIYEGSQTNASPDVLPEEQYNAALSSLEQIEVLKNSDFNKTKPEIINLIFTHIDDLCEELENKLAEGIEHRDIQNSLEALPISMVALSSIYPSLNEDILLQECIVNKLINILHTSHSWIWQYVLSPLEKIYLQEQSQRLLGKILNALVDALSNPREDSYQYESLGAIDIRSDKMLFTLINLYSYANDTQKEKIVNALISQLKEDNEWIYTENVEEALLSILQSIENVVQKNSIINIITKKSRLVDSYLDSNRLKLLYPHCQEEKKAEIIDFFINKSNLYSTAITETKEALTLILSMEDNAKPLKKINDALASLQEKLDLTIPEPKRTKTNHPVLNVFLSNTFFGAPSPSFSTTTSNEEVQNLPVTDLRKRKKYDIEEVPQTEEKNDGLQGVR